MTTASWNAARNILMIAGAAIAGDNAGLHTQLDTVVSDLYVIVPAMISLISLVADLWTHYGTKLVPILSVAISRNHIDVPTIDPKTALEPGILAPVTGAKNKDNQTLVKVVGCLLFCALVLSSGKSEAAQSCNLQTVIKQLTTTNFVTVLQVCSPDDVSAALADAKAQSDGDPVAVACLQPLLGIVQSLANLKVGLVFPFQKFRDAKRANVLANCKSYIDTTISLTELERKWQTPGLSEVS